MRRSFNLLAAAAASVGFVSLANAAATPLLGTGYNIDGIADVGDAFPAASASALDAQFAY